jgi:YYY domain-containing protein
MELAFINAILGSETLPPNDPWLSGYAISYYYFGFILVAMLAKLAGTLGSVAFNLGVSLTFALAAVGSFGVLYNLLVLRTGKDSRQLMPALTAPFFTLILSNWEGFLHYLHSRGVFWAGLPDQPRSRFWNWLDIDNLVDPPLGDSFGHWWWWRASRVIKDYDFSGVGKEVISEFPFFSFLLADLHPHVLSIPYVFLIVGFALALYLKPRQETFQWLKSIPIQLPPLFFIVLAWMAGGMAFLNTWNFPIYVGILAGAYVLRNQREMNSWSIGIMARDFLFMGAALGITGGLFYLPWYLGFSSQAGGIIPNVLYISQGRQFWVMFGPLLIPIFAWLAAAWFRGKPKGDLKAGSLFTLALVLGLFSVMALMVGLMAWLPVKADGTELLPIFLGSVGAGDLTEVFLLGLLRRWNWPGTLITLTALSILGWGLLFHLRTQTNGQRADDSQPANTFTLALIVVGVALVLFPEFLYLKDLFGYRINTIFKFYYQAWLLWSVAAAYGTVRLFQSLKSPGKYIVQAVLALSIVMGMFYPVLGLASKTNNFSRDQGLTLDGTYLFPASDYDGVVWLRSAPPGVIAEAAGESYSTAHSRMATYTGYPTILGWDFHEIQWRGSGELVMPRKNDLATLYCTHEWEIAHELLVKYDVRYLVVGDVEYSKYAAGTENCPGGINQEKFMLHLPTAFQNERLTIYQVPPDLAE